MKLSEMPKNENTIKDDKTKNMKKSYDDLKDLGSDELLERFKREVQQQKEDGTFDVNLLINSIDKIKMYLPEQTYENIKRIIESIR